MQSTWLASSGLVPDSIQCAWVKGFSGGTNPVISGGHLTISTTAPSSHNSYYLMSDTLVSMPTDSVVVTFRARLVSGVSDVTVRAPISVLVETSPYRALDVFIGSGEMFYLSGNTTRGGTAALNTAVMHTYRLVVTGNNFRIYVDGIPNLSGSTFFDNTSGVHSGVPRILWGEGSSLAYGTSEWESFQHNAGKACSVVGVPERARAPLTLTVAASPSRLPSVRLAVPEPARALVTVHDVSGRLVRALLNEHLGAGARSLAWDGLSDAGRRQHSGVYFVRARAGAVEKAVHVVLLR